MANNINNQIQHVPPVNPPNVQPAPVPPARAYENVRLVEGRLIPNDRQPLPLDHPWRSIRNVHHGFPAIPPPIESDRPWVMTVTRSEFEQWASGINVVQYGANCGWNGFTKKHVTHFLGWNKGIWTYLYQALAPMIHWTKFYQILSKPRAFQPWAGAGGAPNNYNPMNPDDHWIPEPPAAYNDEYDWANHQRQRRPAIQNGFYPGFIEEEPRDFDAMVRLLVEKHQFFRPYRASFLEGIALAASEDAMVNQPRAKIVYHLVRMGIAAVCKHVQHCDRNGFSLNFRWDDPHNYSLIYQTYIPAANPANNMVLSNNDSHTPAHWLGTPMPLNDLNRVSKIHAADRRYQEMTQHNLQIQERYAAMMEAQNAVGGGFEARVAVDEFIRECPLRWAVADAGDDSTSCWDGSHFHENLDTSNLRFDIEWKTSLIDDITAFTIQDIAALIVEELRDAWEGLPEKSSWNYHTWTVHDIVAFPYSEWAEGEEFRAREMVMINSDVDLRHWLRVMKGEEARLIVRWIKKADIDLIHAQRSNRRIRPALKGCILRDSAIDYTKFLDPEHGHDDQGTPLRNRTARGLYTLAQRGHEADGDHVRMGVPASQAVGPTITQRLHEADKHLSKQTTIAPIAAIAGIVKLGQDKGRGSIVQHVLLVCFVCIRVEARECHIDYRIHFVRSWTIYRGIMTRFTAFKLSIRVHIVVSTTIIMPAGPG